MKGQFFLLAMIIIMASIVVLIYAFMPISLKAKPGAEELESCVKEAEWAFYNNFTGMQNFSDFLREHGVETIIATQKNGNLTIFNGYGMPAMIKIREQKLGGQIKNAVVLKNTTFSISYNSTVEVRVGGNFVSFGMEYPEPCIFIDAYKNGMEIKDFYRRN